MKIVKYVGTEVPSLFTTFSSEGIYFTLLGELLDTEMSRGQRGFQNVENLSPLSHIFSFEILKFKKYGISRFAKCKFAISKLQFDQWLFHSRHRSGFDGKFSDMPQFSKVYIYRFFNDKVEAEYIMSTEELDDKKYSVVARFNKKTKTLVVVELENFGEFLKECAQYEYVPEA